MKDSWLKRKLLVAYNWCYETRQVLIWRTKYRLRIMSSEQTLRYIKEHNCSIARYGDGEFKCILEARGIGFQPWSNALAEKLTKVLECRDERLLLCVPHHLNTTKGLTNSAKAFWINWGG